MPLSTTIRTVLMGVALLCTIHSLPVTASSAAVVKGAKAGADSQKRIAKDIADAIARQNPRAANLPAQPRLRPANQPRLPPARVQQPPAKNALPAGGLGQPRQRAQPPQQNRAVPARQLAHQLPAPPLGRPIRQTPAGAAPANRLSVNAAPRAIVPSAVARAPRPLPGALINVNPNAARVFDVSLLPNLDLKSVQRRFRQDLAPGIDLGNGQILGRQFESGGVSKVFQLQGSKSKVVKMVPLDALDPAQSWKIGQVLDQEVGRRILNGVKSASDKGGLFSVAKQDSFQIIETAAGTPQARKFAVSIEENIGSPLYDPKSGKMLFNRDRSPRTVVDAASRIANRPSKQLTKREELTINMVIRDLNQKGIVWTDHKLKNLDIVPDKNTVTGHRVIFFDFDAFRPVQGANKAERYSKARKAQRIFDAVPSKRNGAREVTDHKKLVANLRRDIPVLGNNIDQIKRRGRINTDRYDTEFAHDALFDMTAFGDVPGRAGPGQKLGLLATPNANRRRTFYRDINQMDDNAFARTVTQSTKPPRSLSRAQKVGIGSVVVVGGVTIGAGTVTSIAAAGDINSFKEDPLNEVVEVFKSDEQDDE